MARAAVAVCLVLWASSLAVAQSKPYDPYAPQVEDPPVGQDGKINWPPFFKSASTEAKFQEYFKLGSCTGTRKDITEMLKANKVDVNTLPSASVSATAVKSLPGALAAVDGEKKSIVLLTHPKGVSRISVTGSMSPRQVLPGYFVRGVGEVAANGRGVTPLDALHVTSPEAGQDSPPMEPGKSMAFHGQVVKHDNNWIVVRLDGNKRRTVIFELTPRTKIDVQASTLDCVAAGDEIQAKGPVYSGAGSAGARTLFAEEITVVKHLTTP